MARGPVEDARIRNYPFRRPTQIFYCRGVLADKFWTRQTSQIAREPAIDPLHSIPRTSPASREYDCGQRHGILAVNVLTANKVTNRLVYPGICSRRSRHHEVLM